MLRRVFRLIFVVAVAIPATSFGQELVGKWRYDFEDLPMYFIFSDCGVLEIQTPGNSVELTYRVKERGPPLRLDVCPPKDKGGSCSTIFVYLLGESLQIIPDTDVPRSSPSLLTDMLMQRVTDEYGDAHCKTEPDKSSHAHPGSSKEKISTCLPSRQPRTLSSAVVVFRQLCPVRRS